MPFLINLIIWAVLLLVEILFLKFSAEKAYKKKIEYNEAFRQWLWLLGLRFALLLIMGFVVGFVAVIALA